MAALAALEFASILNFELTCMPQSYVCHGLPNELVIGCDRYVAMLFYGVAALATLGFVHILDYICMCSFELERMMHSYVCNGLPTIGDLF